MDNLLGELCGTAVLCAFGCGVNANMSLNKTYGKGGGWICIALGWGLGTVRCIHIDRTLIFLS